MTNQNGLKAAFRALAGKSRLAKHYIKKKLAQDAGEHRVTVNAGSKEGGEGGEWYKSEGENGTAHESIINTLKDQGFNEQPKTETPTAQPRQATPTQQAEGKQYEGTGIENKNDRFEVSFNATPSYKLRTDMKNNGFKWDPNTKVWHTTDREKLDQVLSRHFTERT